MNEEGLKLSDETITEIQKSREEYKKGRFYTLKEVKKGINRK